MPLHIVVVEADDGSWLDEADGFDTVGEARDFAVRVATRHRRAASVYRCDFVATIEPTEPVSFDEWADAELNKAKK